MKTEFLTVGDFRIRKDSIKGYLKFQDPDGVVGINFLVDGLPNLMSVRIPQDELDSEIAILDFIFKPKGRKASGKKSKKEN